ncbi:protein ASPARTIC PROTEASE IN GUARD CELL 1 [Beta vulgaris subsp. vulgaris]|uniref:protein ASPARTIC PROTEASE IN GUARD CELL 1 n=1 Tax=Beta vulgaris subsp. vulgaris TaxID=3555 RepID=UPI002036E1C1|nr:protein ASPARTIC PROTEASE IN GUARD CELL 1 [Beta vulgaris subsp. vulgaris]
MAKTNLFSLHSSSIFSTFAIFTLLFSLPLACCWNNYLSRSKACILNVTTSLQKITPNFPKLNPPYLQSSNSSHSLKLVQSSNLTSFRYSYYQQNNDHYKSQLVYRVARDSIRIKSIQNRLDVAIEPSLRSPIISGISQGSGEYFSRVGIGQPAREIYVIIDTGSDLSWVQCEPCTQCYIQPDPIFDPSQSTSFVSLPCNSTTCNALDESECHAGSCIYEVSYGDGSYTTGEFVTETITFDGGSSVGDFAIGCGHNNDGFFTGASGLLGLGGGALSLPSQINATSFSYCLVDRESNSTSSLNFNTNTTILPPDPTLITAPLLSNPTAETFYYLGLIGISVGGTELTVPTTAFQIDKDGSGGVIIDTGTAVTRLETRVYELLRDEFRKGTTHLPTTDEVAIFDTCYDLRGKESVEVPTLEFHFAGGKTLALPAKNYVIPVDTEGTFCLAFAPTTASMSIIGNVQQEGIRVGFNLVYSLVTFEPNQC